MPSSSIAAHGRWNIVELSDSRRTMPLKECRKSHVVKIRFRMQFAWEKKLRKAFVSEHLREYFQREYFSCWKFSHSLDFIQFCVIGHLPGPFATVECYWSLKRQNKTCLNLVSKILSFYQNYSLSLFFFKLGSVFIDKTRFPNAADWLC